MIRLVSYPSLSLSLSLSLSCSLLLSHTHSSRRTIAETSELPMLEPWRLPPPTDICDKSLSFDLSFSCSPALFLSLSHPLPEFKCQCSQLFLPTGIRTTHHIINLKIITQNNIFTRCRISTNSQPWHTGENHSGIALATNISPSVSLSIVQNRSKTKFCLINHLTTFSRYFHDIQLASFQSFVSRVVICAA